MASTRVVGKILSPARNGNISWFRHQLQAKRYIYNIKNSNHHYLKPSSILLSRLETKRCFQTNNVLLSSGEDGVKNKGHGQPNTASIVYDGMVYNHDDIVDIMNRYLNLDQFSVNLMTDDVDHIHESQYFEGLVLNEDSEYDLISRYSNIPSVVGDLFAEQRAEQDLLLRMCCFPGYAYPALASQQSLTEHQKFWLRLCSNVDPHQNTVYPEVFNFAHISGRHGIFSGDDLHKAVREQLGEESFPSSMQEINGSSESNQDKMVTAQNTPNATCYHENGLFPGGTSHEISKEICHKDTDSSIPTTEYSQDSFSACHMSGDDLLSIEVALDESSIWIELCLWNGHEAKDKHHQEEYYYSSDLDFSNILEKSWDFSHFFHEKGT